MVSYNVVDVVRGTTVLTNRTLICTTKIILKYIKKLLLLTSDGKKFKKGKERKLIIKRKSAGS